MAIATRKPGSTTSQLPEPKEQTVEASNIKSSIVDNNFIPIVSLIGYVEGAPWTVDYYSQIVGQGNDLRDLDTQQSGTYQSYKKIIDMELRTTSDLSQSHDQASGQMTVTGSGVIYPFLVPNVGDVFVADVATGRKGVFRISSAERTTYRRDSVYNVEYTFIAFADENSEAVDDLNSKVGEEYHFHKDRMLMGLNPAVIPSEHQNIVSLEDSYYDLVQHYFAYYHNSHRDTLMVPGQMAEVYDPFVVNFIKKLVNTNDAPQIRNTTELTTTSLNKYIKQPHFFTMLLERKIEMLKMVNPKMTLVTSDQFDREPGFEGFRYGGIPFMVYPANPDTSANSGIGTRVKTPAEYKIEKPPVPQWGSLSLEDNSCILANTTAPYIKEVLIDDYYVFSETFYKNSVGKSVLESLTLDYLNFKNIDRKRLVELTQRAYKWGHLEQFYYIPVLIILIKASLSS